MIEVAALVDGVQAGSRADIARALTLVESTRGDHRIAATELLRSLRPAQPAAIRVGISGVPGAGKSTLIDAWGTRLIAAGHRVAVLAVDPSSVRSGGSILGDRTRMSALAAAPEAFVRPSPTGGELGGVARTTRESMLVMEAAGFDVVLVETVGVGQSEVAVAGMVDTFVLIALARTGDQLQGIKRGVLELADVICVNKADGDHAQPARLAARELGIALHYAGGEHPARVLTTSALTGAGLDEAWQAVLAHRTGLEADGGLAAHRARQQVQWMWALFEATLRREASHGPAVQAVADDLQRLVAAGELSAAEGADRLLRALAADVANRWQ